MTPHNMSRSITAATVVAAVLAPVSVVAAEAAGNVYFAVGDVSAVASDGQRRNLARGSSIHSGETIETANGRAQVRFTDGAHVSLRPNSEFRIDDYSYDEKSDGDRKGFFNLLRGGLRTITGLIGKRNRANYRMRTAVATIGIRGTEFTLNYGNSVRVEVVGGVVTIDIDGDGEADFEMPAGANGTFDEGEFAALSTFIQALLAAGDDDAREEILAILKDGDTNTLEDKLAELEPQLPALAPAIAGVEHPNCSNGACTMAYAFGEWGEGEGGQGAALADGGEGLTVSAQFNSVGSNDGIDDGALVSYGEPPLFADTGSLNGGVTQRGGSDQYIAWGRWTGDTNGSDPHDWTNFDETYEAFHYVVGVQPPSFPMGTFEYSLYGFTTPSFDSAGIAGALGTGAVTGGTLIGDFDNMLAYTGTPISVFFNGNGDTYQLSINGLNISAQGTFEGSTTAMDPVAVTAGAGCMGGCDLDVAGLFAGSNSGGAPPRGGVTFSVDDGYIGGAFQGAVTFTNPVPGSPPPPP